MFLALSLAAPGAPLSDPVAPARIPAGKSLIVAVTGSAPTGRPLTCTASSSTTRIQDEVHTNKP